MKTLKTILTIAALTSAAMITNGVAALDTNQLANSIEESLTNHFPNVDQMKIGQESQKIAEQCISVAANSDALYRGLTNAFSTNTALNLGTNDAAIDRAAAAVINREDFGIVPMSLLQSNAPSLPYMAFISVGAEFNNPYQIVSLPTGGYSLTNGNNRTAGYLQFDYINRFATRDPQKELAYEDQWELSTNNWFGGHLANPLKAWPDVQAQIGFLFDNGGTTVSNYSASTLVGSGDFYAQAGAGFPFWRMISPDLTMRQQASFELSGGFTADNNFERLHPNMFLGMGYETAFVPGFGSYSTNTPGFFMGKAGAAWADTPKFENNSGSLISTNANDGMPDFSWNLHPAVQVYLAWPLTKSVFLTVEGNAYFQVNSQQEAAWNVKVGASIPLGSITTMFSSFLGN